MNYSEFVRDFADRTLKNLQLVRRTRRGHKDRYEVTQLVNSLLGLIVIPHELMHGKIPPHRLEKLQKDGWPLFTVHDDTTDCDNLRLLVENLRNGIAHGKLKFEGHPDIRSITITNQWEGKSWKGTIGIGDLRRFVDLFGKELIRVCDRNKRKGAFTSPAKGN